MNWKSGRGVKTRKLQIIRLCNIQLFIINNSDFFFFAYQISMGTWWDLAALHKARPKSQRPGKKYGTMLKSQTGTIYVYIYLLYVCMLIPMFWYCHHRRFYVKRKNYDHIEVFFFLFFFQLAAKSSDDLTGYLDLCKNHEFGDAAIAVIIKIAADKFDS